MNNMFIRGVLAVIPLLCFIYIFFFRKYSKVVFTVGLIVYLGTIGFLRQYKSLQGKLITQQSCETLHADSVTNFNQCGFMLKNTIDIATKATLRANCVEDIAKLKNDPSRKEECKNIAALYRAGVIEWNKDLTEYERKVSQ